MKQVAPAVGMLVSGAGHREVQDDEGRPGEGAEQAKATALSFNTAHNNEHYGNPVTYLRMKGLAPPSSERR